MVTGTPLVFTSYNEEEAEDDAKVMEGMGAQIRWKHEMNPFASEVPYLDASAPDTFFYNNSYYGCVEGRAP